MRGVIIGTDFVRDTDGSFKSIETNTNVQLDLDVSLYFNPDSLDTLISGSSINEIVYVSKNELENQVYDLDLDSNNNIVKGNYMPLRASLNKYCKDKGLTFTPIIVENNSITVPHVDDSDTKLIIRMAYDVTALIDDTYARDNWQFLKLMYDTNPSSIPKTYINDSELGFDSLGNVIRDNGVHPNYCVKKRITPTDNKVFPKLLRISSIAEINALKESLEVDEYIQEYIYNPNDLLDNRIKHYRSVDLLYGPNLDILNLWVIESSNNFQLDLACDYDDFGLIQYWERPKYLSKFINAGDKDPHLSGDENTMVLMQDNSKVKLSSLDVGSVIKTISIPNLPINELDYHTNQWSSSYTDFIENYQIDTATLKGKQLKENWVGFFYELQTTDGIVFSDVSQAAILVKTPLSGSTEEYIVKFETYAELEVGDTILLFNTETSTISDKQISSILLSYGMVNVYTTDFEQIDVFMTMEESENSKWGIVTHNYTFDCRTYYYYPNCHNCGTGNFGIQSTYGCCRCNGNYFACHSAPSTCLDNIDQLNQTPCSTGDYCNGQKSDKRLKKKIKHIKTLENGIKIYQFEFKSHFIKKNRLLYDDDISGTWEGVLAQDLIGTSNEIYVSMDTNRYYQVDYQGLGVRLTKIKN